MLLWLGIPGRECYSVGRLAVQADLESILPRSRQGNVEHEHRARFDIDHTGWGLTELHCTLSPEELSTRVVHETDPDGMNAYFGASSPHSEHKVGPGIYRGEVGEPHVLKHAQYAELALLIDEGVVGDDSEVEVQGSGDSN